KEYLSSDTVQPAVPDAPSTPFQVKSIARPFPGAGQVLVRIAASGVNPLDIKIYAGQAAHARHPLPGILGMNLAGTVEAVGSDVKDFARGDEVYGMTGGVGGLQGSLAQYVGVDADLLARKPNNLPIRETASLPLNIITAWEGLVDRADVQAGQIVLVHGGAGGVGHLAVQIARARGAKVFATGSPKDKAYIEGIGATFIDYTIPVADYVGQHSGGPGLCLGYHTPVGTG